MNTEVQLPSSFGALLFTRAWPNRSVVDEFDAWQQRRHFPDLVALPGVGRADYYRIVESGLPQVLQGTGNRIAIYWSRSLDELFTFLTHPGLAEAVEDGSRFFPSFNELDGDTYTGNIYRLEATIDIAQVATSDGASHLLLVERYETGNADADEFRDWLSEVHVPQLLAAGPVCAIRTGEAVREELPIPYYNSPGNHVVLALLDSDVRAVAVDSDLMAAFADGQTWDRRLSYVRREVAELAFRNESTTIDARPAGVDEESE